MKAAAAALALAAALASPALAQEGQAARASEAVLQSYEPNTIGFTWDSDDERFLDVKLSLRFPLMPELMHKWRKDSELSFAATVRFAQYLGTRESSPVIGKRFNPKLIWRESVQGPLFLEYLDFAYAHESNGQSINSPEEYAFEAARQRVDGNRPEAAKDFISRGWDYLEVAGKHVPRRDKANRKQWTVYSSFRYFLEDGLLQGAAEEYNTWENDPEGKPRKEVQGLAALWKYEHWRGGTISRTKLAAGMETGYSRPFRYNTFRVEGGVEIAQLPFVLFYQNGYNSDLAQYYKRVSTIGLALELGTR
jgi:hypothetical protein